ncbi:hypothetical protein ABEF95_003171 [Exophiala dermatitidis]
MTSSTRALLRSFNTGGHSFAELTDPQIQQVALSIASTTTTPSEILYTDTNLPYKAQDLNVGEVKRVPGPPLSDLGTLAAEQFNLITQDAAFRIVKLDHRIEAALPQAQPWIPIQGIDRTFYHYQLYAAWWLLSQEHESARRGAIEGDLMGLGKTSIALLTAILRSLITDNAIDVQTNPQRHLPAEDSMDSTKFCPSRDTFAVECACHRRSPAFGWKKRPGATLIFVPASLIGTWESEWTKLGVDRQNLRVDLFIQHEDYRLASLPGKLYPRLRLQWLGKTVAAEPARPHAHRLIVLTTVESYQSCVVEVLNNGRAMPDPNTGSRVQTDGLAWGLVMRDEAHLTRNLETRLYTALTGLAQNGAWSDPPSFVALTGTPLLRNGILDMLPLVKMINLFSPKIADDKRYSDFLDHATLVIAANDLAGLMRRQQSKAGLDSVGSQMIESYGQFFARLLALYTIRRRSDSFQNGKILAYIPPLEQYDLICRPQGQVAFPSMSQIEDVLKKKLNRAWESELALFLRRGGSAGDFEPSERVLLANVYIGRLLATAPALARMGRRDKLSWSYLKQQGWHRRPKQSEVYRRIAELEASSGKLQTLRAVLTSLDHCKTWDGEQEKLVIISDIVYTCHVAECFCLYYGYDAKWMHADLSTAERQQLVDDFQDSIYTSSSIRILIGTSAILGQGVTLNRAHRVVLMEPSRHGSVEDQNADRVHRLGIKSDRCFVYRLVNQQSQVETLLVESQTHESRIRRLVEALKDDRVGSTSSGDSGCGQSTDMTDGQAAQLRAFIEDDCEVEVDV